MVEEEEVEEMDLEEEEIEEQMLEDEVTRVRDATFQNCARSRIFRLKKTFK